MVEFRQVLCAVDLSEQSVRTLKYAGAVARWYGGRVTALHVVPPFDPMEARVGGLFDPVTIVNPVPREAVVDRVREALDAADIPSGSADVAAEAGETTATIVDQCVARRVDLLVIGTHGHSGFDRLMLGSVAEKLLRKATTDVASVPPHSFVSAQRPSSAGQNSAEQLGHAGISTTLNIYTHTIAASHRDAVVAVEGCLFSNVLESPDGLKSTEQVSIGETVT